jgi:hypothetical protein
MAESTINYGEHPGGRRAMEDLTRRLREMGVPAKDAEKRARETALREDRRRNGRQ